LNLSEAQIALLAPKPTSFNEGKKLGYAANWVSIGKSDRAVWGVIQGSGANPYLTKIDFNDLAFQCNCPSRQFPCKHALGLMLIFADGAQPPKASIDEPEWVSSWLDKRSAKTTASEDEQKKQKDDESIDPSKEKRQQDRLDAVDSGIEELELWLSDLVRIGLLELPSKPASLFDNMAARMVDSKAPGLAGWVRTLGKINYSGHWEDEATQVLGKIYLLIAAWKNISNLPEPWQHTIRNLVGWNQSTKDLMDDPTAVAIKDEWVVLGQEIESMDDLIIQRTWLWGCIKNHSAMLLQFGTRFSPLQNMVVPGSVLEGEVAYFPGIHLQRAIVRKQRGLLSHWSTKPAMESNLSSVWEKHMAVAATYPWINDQAYLVNNARIIQVQNEWYLLDEQKKMMALHSSFHLEKFMKWMMVTGNAAVDTAFAIKGKTAFLLGIINENEYTTL
jgi:hypothetical protein